MNKERRLFINQLSVVSALAALSKPATTLANVSKNINSLHSLRNEVTVYHTCDLHGNLTPSNGQLGGLVNIQKVLNNQDTGGLLLDGGDFLSHSKSGSNQLKVIDTMNKMGYHAAAIGNEELAIGQDRLASLVPLMNFSLVNCNYSLERNLSKLVKPYITINAGKFKVGITGVGQKLKGVAYADAIESANSTAKILKENENCDLVICLSHLGYNQPGDQPDDQKLAQRSSQIDMIISGHNRFLVRGTIIKMNKLKHEVLISPAAYDGLMIGKTIFSFENGKQKSNIKSKNL
ncbi:metallophosphoesterase, partial [uncultured Mucilaginibacter sp.]|uniref:metallophosphoesterase n=1 Tax=uncultured Mucilaginibacter sp. TaxID=797541 RepID=UPI0025FFC46C